MKMILSFKNALRAIEVCKDRRALSKMLRTMGCGLETQHTVRDPQTEEEDVEEGAESAGPSNKQKKRAAWAAQQKARAGEEK